MCGDYVRHVFSIVPGSLAAISLLIVLVFQTSQTSEKRNGEIHRNLCPIQARAD